VGVLVRAAVVLGVLITACGDADTPNTDAAPSAMVTTAPVNNEEPTTSTSNPGPTSTTPPASRATTVTTTVPPSATTMVRSTVDLEAVDWANHSYPFGCPGEQSAEVTLVSGEGITDSFFYGLGHVVFGSMGALAEPVAVVELTCTGAGSFPSSVLIYGGSGINEQFLGVAASAESHLANPDTNPWAINGPLVIENGTLVMTGEGWTTGAPHCCQNLTVFSKVTLDENKTPYDFEHIETPL
jgi:hypothetical protein